MVRWSGLVANKYVLGWFWHNASFRSKIWRLKIRTNVANAVVQDNRLELRAQPNLNRMPYPPRGYSQATLRCSSQMMRQVPHSRQPSLMTVTWPLPSMVQQPAGQTTVQAWLSQL